MALNLRTLLQSSALAGSFFFIGDTTAQILTGKVKLPPRLLSIGSKTDSEAPLITTKELSNTIATWDYERTLKMTAFGFGVNGWFFLTGFHVLDKLIGPSKTFQLAATKSILNQIFFSPPYLCAFLYYSAAYVNPPQPGVTPMDAVVQKFPNVYASAWAIWPAVNLISFRYLPPGLARVAFLNGMGIGWNAYLATIGASPSVVRDNEYAL
ncbi:hypothetical protein HDU79_009038 [Rhizoclosmatium sp. JEL0117]|nr:hypothetical protein HDU79_009038 [Rhizoclosmatium sp. JEL0117]